METAGGKSSSSGAADGTTKRTQDTTPGTMEPVTTTPSGGGGGSETANTTSTTGSDSIDGKKGNGNDGKDPLGDALGNSAAADSDRGSTFAEAAAVSAETATAVDTLMAAARGQINHSSRVVSTGSDPSLSPACQAKGYQGHGGDGRRREHCGWEHRQRQQQQQHQQQRTLSRLVATATISSLPRQLHVPVAPLLLVPP